MLRRWNACCHSDAWHHRGGGEPLRYTSASTVVLTTILFMSRTFNCVETNFELLLAGLRKHVGLYYTAKLYA